MNDKSVESVENMYEAENFQTALGNLYLRASAKGLVEISYRKGVATSGANYAAVKHLRRTQVQLTEYFLGKRKSFKLVFDLDAVPPYRRAVLEHLTKLPAGKTITYIELARQTGNPGAVRAVGSAMSSNPLVIVIPCHRVVPTRGGVGAYAGGVARKRKLLELERAEV